MSPRLSALCSALGLGPDPEVILEPLVRFYSEIDRELAKGAAGLELPCRAGCDACCHESVFVSAPELLMVASELLETKSTEEIARVVEQMRALAARFADELELLESIERGAERDEVAARVRFRCPLLGEDGRCTVYRSRELNARTFGQSADTDRGEPYGCALTHERLKVLPPEAAAGLFGAREARRRLASAVPGTERVHVYPWWFDRYGDLLTGACD